MRAIYMKIKKISNSSTYFQRISHKIYWPKKYVSLDRAI